MKNVIFRQREKELLAEELGARILENSRNELYLKLRFLSPALYGCKYIADYGMQPLGTDGENLLFSPEPVMSLFEADRRMVNRTYLHLLIHLIFCHVFVRPDDRGGLPGPEEPADMAALVDMAVLTDRAALADMAAFPETAAPEAEEDVLQAARLAAWREREERWDLAADIVAEYVLDGLYLPCVHKRKTTLRLRVFQELEKEYKVVTAQAVFFWLAGQSLFSPSELAREFTSDDHHMWKNIPPNKRRQLQDKWEDIRKKMQTEMEIFSDEASDDSKSLYDQLKVENRRRYDYRSFLRKFTVLREEMEIDADSFDYIFYCYGLQMYGNMPLIEPLETREVPRIEELVIVIDTSMSCKGELVRQFLEETYSILMQQETYARKFHIRLIQCDEKVQKDQLVTNQEEFEAYIRDFTVIGQGGTDFRPAFTYVNYLVRTGAFRKLRGLLYFTDGYGIFPVKKPVYDTVFLFMKDDYSDADVPPWAIKIILDPLEWEGRIR